MGLDAELQTASIYFCLMVGAKILKLSKAGLASPLSMQLICKICSAHFLIYNLYNSPPEPVSLCTLETVYLINKKLASYFFSN
jgi:hypothetical protein